MHQQFYPQDTCRNPLLEIPYFAAEPSRLQGSWELDIISNQLYWSENQFRIYGYDPKNIKLDHTFFVENTTHNTDVLRIREIIKTALVDKEEYGFKRRIVKKDGSIGFAETKAVIIRRSNSPVFIKGVTTEISGTYFNGEYDYNDPVFFKQLYNNYRKAIYNETLRLVGCNELAKDLCQEIFLKAWTHMLRYDKSKGELYTWLINICRNHCLDYFRSKDYKNSKKSSSFETLTKDISSDQHYELGKTSIKNLLSRLSPDQKELLDLLFIQGYSQSQVANIKKLPLGTVKTRSRSAINNLKQIASTLI